MLPPLKRFQSSGGSRSTWQVRQEVRTTSVYSVGCALQPVGTKPSVTVVPDVSTPVCPPYQPLISSCCAADGLVFSRTPWFNSRKLSSWLARLKLASKPE